MTVDEGNGGAPSSDPITYGQTYVGRQAIYDVKLGVFAYELLYRAAANATHASYDDQDRASSQTIVGAICDIGLDQLVGDRLCFINLTHDLLISGSCMGLPHEQVVIEVLENVRPEPDLIDRVIELSEAGFRVALDDFVDKPEWSRLAEMADIIKVDVLGRTNEQITQEFARLRRFPAKLLAEKVETREQLEHCKRLGFEYFQGFFLRKPDIVEGKRMPGSRLANLKLLADLQDPDVDFPALEESIRQDAGLSYKLLRFLNSASVALPRPVDSLHQALVFTGMRRLRAWLSFIVMASFDQQPEELLCLAMVRARMCELMAEASRRKDKDRFFTVGMLSATDALAGRSMADLVQMLPISQEIKVALLEEEGVLGEALHCALAYECGNWGEANFAALAPQTISVAYMRAVRWTEQVMNELIRKK